MTVTRLVPYGSNEHAANVAKVGKTKTPGSLVARMPSASLAAKVGPPSGISGIHRVTRLNSRG